MESDRLSNTLSDGTRDGQQRGRPLHGRTSGPTRRSTKGQWTAEEDEILRMAVQRFKGKNWKKIAECFKDRTDVQCLHRWQKVLNPDLVKGPWSKEEDEIIIQMVDKYGPKKWSTIAQHLPGRIGKQCRERWHNHLNPNINKEAWTQEEELALIRAHQVYGNKWAELTKYLPGRTDNSIKNHWNSSLKKKLDMYLASGLLSQFQGQPLVTMVNQSTAASSSRVQRNSEDDSIPKEKIEMEEASECSQGSAINRAAHPIADCSANEELGPFMRSKDYRPVFQEDTFGCETSENFLEHGLPLDWGKFAGTDWEFNSNELPDMSLLDLGQESSDPFMPSLNRTDSHGTEPILPETSTAVAPLTCRTNMVAINNTPNLPANSDNRVLYSDTGHDGYLPSENMCTQVNGLADSLLHSNYQTLEDQNFLPQSFYMTSDMLENSFTQTFPIPTQLSYNDSQVMISQDTDGGHHPSLDNIEQESNPPNTHEGFIPDSIPCEDNSNEANGSPKRVQANDFVLAQSNDSQCDTSKEKDTVQTDKQDPGSISYNPPRFPSLDMPFFSCDLIQSGTDLHQDYSPLGIRQLMISSSLTPFKLWDSPSRDDSSPDAVLRNAAKTFTGTPSILKKRSRDLVSPLSEKRSEKKKERSNLRNNSGLGALFDECVEMKEVVASPNPKTEEEFEEDCSDKENVAPGHTEGVKDEMGKDEMQKEHKFSGILQEHDMNDLIFLSPDRFGIKNDRAMGLSARALGNRYSKRLEAASTNGAFFSAAETSCFSVVCSPRLSNKKDGTSLVIASTSLQSLSPSAKKVESSGNCAVSENNSIFFDTPFRRSMESPSGWKSPWLFGTTFVPGPRVDTDITIEDIGYLLSPGERSYDAIGLMKQLGEQTARAFADAQEVLGDETPDTIMKTPNPNSNADLQNHLTSQSMTERRTLDFSECGTPVKQTENISSSTGHASPSTLYLLKSCR